MAVAILFNFHLAFLANLINWVSQDKIKNDIDLKKPNSQRLKDLKIKENDIITGLSLLEFIIYFLVAFWIGYQFFIFDIAWYYGLIIIIFSFLAIIFLRSIIIGLAIKYADNLIDKYITAIELHHKIIKPIHVFYEILQKKISGKEIDKTSRDDISALFETAHDEGSIETDEYLILKNILNFDEVLVSDVMTPRTVIFACSSNKPIKEIIGKPELKMYSRIPIFDGDSLDDEVIGYVMSKDILLAALQGEGSKILKDFKRDIYTIPESVELAKALEQFLKRRQHMAMVVDEYGDVSGLITMEDVLETILGVEIVDEADKIVDLRELAKLRRDKRINSILK